MITYDNIWKIAIGEGDDYTTGCLLHYPYFNNYNKMLAKDLSKQQVLDADPKAIQQVNFTRSRWKHHNVFHYWRSEKKINTLDLS